MSVTLTGSTGFIGKNLLNYLRHFNINVECVSRDDLNNIDHYFDISTNTVINLVGKAHDLKNSSSQEEYYSVNTELTKKLFNAFLVSSAKVFITISSVKAVADEIFGELTEDIIPNPKTHYGKSKLLAEEYILSQSIPDGKRVYILRPCMIHGPGNKGNLNLLYNFIANGYPYPLGLFENSRSYLSIENLCFVIKELVERDDIQSGIYNVADDVPLSTNEVIQLISKSKNEIYKSIKFNKSFIIFLALVGDYLKLPINSERLQKLTSSYVVSNMKIKDALSKPFPVSSKEGLRITFQSFSKN